MGHVIKHANIEITNQCDQKCFYCFNNSGQARADELSFDSWLRILRRMQQWGLRSILVTGGEPFIRTGIMDFLGETQAIGLETNILSNGFRVPEYTRTHRDILMRITLAQISLDAMNPEIHDRRRGKIGAWKQAIEAIETFINLCVPVEVSCTVSLENIGELRAIAEYCYSSGTSLLIRPCKCIGRGANCTISEDINARLNCVLHLLEEIPVNIVGDRFLYVPSQGTMEKKSVGIEAITVCSDGRIRVEKARINGLSELPVSERISEVA